MGIHHSVLSILRMIRNGVPLVISVTKIVMYDKFKA